MRGSAETGGMGGMSRRASAAVVGMAAIALLAAPNADAGVSSDRAGAILIFPKLVVDSERGLDTFVRLSNTSDREISLLCFYVNATPKCSLPSRSCFPDPDDCETADGTCIPQWQESDFRIRVTARQPVGWLVSQGARANCSFLPGICANDESQSCAVDRDCGLGNHCVVPPCFPLDGTFRVGRPFGAEESNIDSAVIPAPEDPFLGELKCIAVDEGSLVPVARNDLVGEVLIGRRTPEGIVDVAAYNALGIPAIEGRGNRDSTLVLGGPRVCSGGTRNGQPCAADSECTGGGKCAFDPRVEYEGCPNILILDHFFDGAVDPLIPNLCQVDGTCRISDTTCQSNRDCENRCEGETCTVSGGNCDTNADCSELVGQVRLATDLTLVPCTQDLRTQNPSLSETTAQFLVFNEFEQRFSTSRSVNCFKESRLSNLDTPQNERSIFSAGVAGTLTGQTRIRGVDEGAVDHGNTLIGVVEEFRCVGPGFPLCSFVSPADLVSSSATNLHFQGTRPVSDFLYLP